MIPSRVFFVTRKRLTSTWQCTTFVFPPRLKWSGVRLRRTSRCRLLPAVYISTGFGVKLSLTPFVRDVLVRFKVPPSQLTLRPWRTVLGFEALRAAFAPDTYGVEEFCATHNVMTKTHQDARSFVPRSGCDGSIINLVGSDHGWHDTIIRVSGPWEAVQAKDRGRVLTMWNRGPVPKGGAPLPNEMYERVKKLYRLNYDYRN